MYANPTVFHALILEPEWPMPMHSLRTLRICPTLNRRIHIKTLFRPPWQHKTEDTGWQHGQNPVFAMVFGIASEAFIVLYGSIYHRSPRYKSLIPNPGTSHRIGDNEIKTSSLQNYKQSAEYANGDIFVSQSTAFADRNCRAVHSERIQSQLQ